MFIDNFISFKIISIHTPARGVTTMLLEDHILETISIHTPARGVTILENVTSGEIKISIHTPARGVTHEAVHGYRKPQFQSTLPQGE